MDGWPKDDVRRGCVIQLAWYLRRNDASDLRRGRRESEETAP